MEVVKSYLAKSIVITAAVIVLQACNQKGIYTKGYYSRGQDRTAAPTIVPSKTDYYIVQKGDTLYSIAWQHGYDHRQLAAWNNIKAPYTIFPSQRVRVTPPASSSRTTQARTTKSARPPRPTGSSKKAATARPVWSKKVHWNWPAQGRLLSTFSNTDAARKGVDIGGRLGQPVLAAAAGTVVYSGNGLRGYGNLIIVKHNEEFFSAYAHNNKNRVKENQTVKASQRIADMGKSGTDKVKLHFEIRRDGKPVNPLRYLPKHRK